MLKSLAWDTVNSKKSLLTQMWVLVSRHEFNGTEADYTFSNLNCDLYEMYRIISYAGKKPVDPTPFYLLGYINGDTGANYIRQYLKCENASISTDRETISNIYLAYNKGSDDNFACGDIIIRGKSGSRRFAYTQGGIPYEDQSGGSVGMILESYLWNNTIDNITSFKVGCNTSAPASGSWVEIWRKS